MKVKFLGASRIVTGSNILVETENEKFLIDCGMFQGSKELEKRNWEDFKFNPSEIDFMLLSHAHIDHSGRIPKLVNEGFKGTIYTTNATKDLLDVMLKDSAKIQENDADWENKKRKRAGKKAIKPLYTTNDAKNSLKYVKDLNYDSFYKINDSISVRFLNAGHMLGSSIIEIYVKESSGTSKLVFSGDLGMRVGQY